MAAPLEIESGAAWPRWAEPARVIGFVSSLRDVGYRVDARHCMAVQDLLVALTARGESLDDPMRLARHIGPIICSTPDEQADFPRRFRSWARSQGEASGRGPAVAPPPPTLEQAVSEGVRGWRKAWRVIIPALALGIVAFVASKVRVTTPAPVHGTPLPAVVVSGGPGFAWTLVAAVGAAIVAAAVAWRLWWRHRAKLFLEQRAVAGRPEVDSLVVKALTGPFEGARDLSGACSELRRRVESQDMDVDLAQTLERSLRGGGLTEVVFRLRPVTPEHLVLVDRTTAGDHQASLYSAFCDELRASQVPVTLFFFDGDPRICFPDRGGSPVTLSEIADRHAYHRLIVFAPASMFFDRATGQTQPWLDELSRWHDRAILTPAQGDLRPEIAGRLLDFRVFQASPSGLSGLAAAFATRGGRPWSPAAPEGGRGSIPLPRALSDWPARWLERDPPGPTEIAEMMDDLRLYLGAEGFAWLSSLAIYPALSWNLTLYLGSALRTSAGVRTIDRDCLARLARLPWLRHASMPLWLRHELVARLAPADAGRIRDALDRLLTTAVEGGASGERRGFSLDIVRQRPRALHALSAALLDRVTARGRGAELKDYVFKSFMSRGGLGFAVPARLRWWFLAQAGAEERAWVRPLVALAGPIVAYGPMLLAGVLGQSFRATTAPVLGNVKTLSMLSVGIQLVAAALAALLCTRFDRRRQQAAFAGVALVLAIPAALSQTFNGFDAAGVDLLLRAAAGFGVGVSYGWASRLDLRERYFRFVGLYAVWTVALELGSGLDVVADPLRPFVVLSAIAAVAAPMLVLASLPSARPHWRTPVGPAKPEPAAARWDWVALGLVLAAFAVPLGAIDRSLVGSTRIFDCLTLSLLVLIGLRLAPRGASLITGMCVVGYAISASIAPDSNPMEPLAALGRWLLLARAASVATRAGSPASLAFLSLGAGEILLDLTSEPARVIEVALQVGSIMVLERRRFRWKAGSPPKLRRRNARLLLAIPAMFFGGYALTLIGALIGFSRIPVVEFLATALVYVGVIWGIIGTRAPIRELRALTHDRAFNWWLMWIPWYNLYWYWSAIPMAVSRTKRALGLANPKRSGWLYFIAFHYALACDANEIADAVALLPSSPFVPEPPGIPRNWGCLVFAIITTIVVLLAVAFLSLR
ncbi:MAG TPA: hypothetical protein VKU41_29970 [Polyangiaceae bacterium]|nr:hypothetical protein [Polyangiaceae bacterium]